MSAPYIRLEKQTASRDRLDFEFSSSLDVFSKKSFFIRYEGLMVEAPESVRLVPFAALMAPIAMATGAALSMPSLDEDFAVSLRRCEMTWRKFFPKWNFDRYRLDTELVRSAPAAADADAMLFSGGLDSLSAYLHYRARKPHLFSIIGADIPITQTQFIAECREKIFSEFARTEEVGITYIHSDVRETVDLSKMRKYSLNWYPAVQFGVLLTGLTAPVSYGRFSKIIIASCSHRPDDVAPCAADPRIVRGLRWASTQVEDNQNEATRVQKAGFLKGRPALFKYLRVCWEQFDRMNCGRCKKCLRTICELLLNNTDPNLANFAVDERTLPELRKKMTSEYHLFLGCDKPAVNFWRDIQDSISLQSLEDRFGSKEFFSWLKDFQPLKKNESRLVCRLLALSEKAKKVRPGKLARYIQYQFSRAGR